MQTEKYRLNDWEKRLYNIAVETGDDPQELLSDPGVEETLLLEVKARIRHQVVRAKLLGNPRWAKARVIMLESKAQAGTI